MKKYKFGSLIGCVILIFLEMLPVGAVLTFAGDGGETVRKTYSYFSLLPYGYANFGPFLTAVLAVVLTVLTLINLFSNKKWLLNASITLSATAIVTSLLPLMLGTDYFTPTAVIITLLLSALTALNIFTKKHQGETI
ncbi:MAG: hypothetical protein IJB74_06210 [Clostridia bacterium]|nr:hypothetical protein [Clostridia bacterium]